MTRFAIIAVRGLVAVLVVLCCVAPGWPQTAVDHLEEALRLYQAGQYEACLEACELALDLDPEMSEAYRRRGYVYWKLGDASRALEELDRALAADPDNAKAWIGKFNIYYHLHKDYQAAEDACSRAIALDVTYVNAWINRAAARLKLDMPKAVIEDCNSALLLDPESSMALNSRGIARKNLGDLEGALDDLSRALQLSPGSLTASFNRAQVRSQLGDLDGAIADISRVIESNPEDAQALRLRGQFQMQSGRLAAARRDLDTALRIAPGSTAGQRLVEQLEQLEHAAAQQTAQSRPATGSHGPAHTGQPALPTITFRADEDPCRVAASTPTDGLPWDDATGSNATSPPTNTGPAGGWLDLESLSTMQYAGAVSTAKEVMAVLYGPMSAADSQRFENAWAPLFDHPSPAVVDYLNRLNPLLGWFLTDREAFLRVSNGYQAALFDCALAVAADSEQGLFDALAMAGQQERLMHALLERLQQTASRIEQLGNPPNPLADKCAARQRYRRAFPARPGSPLDGVWSDEYGNETSVRTLMTDGEDRWLVYRVSHDAIATYRGYEERGYDITQPGLATRDEDDDDPVGVPGIADMVAVVERQPDDQLLVWQPVSFFMILEAWEPVGDAVYDRTESKESYLEKTTTVTTGRFWHDQHAEPQMFPHHTSARLQRHANEFGSGLLSQFARYRAANAAELDALLAGDARSSLRPTPSAPVPTRSAAASDVPEAEDVSDSTVEFHRSMIDVLGRNLQREHEELARTTDPRRREDLALRILHLRSDIQAEQDLITSYRTGRIVHTRSAFDEYAQQQFIARLENEAERIDRTRKIAAAIERQIQLLPEDQRAAMRRKAWQLLDASEIATGDLEEAQRLARAMNEQVQGYWQGRAADAEEEAIVQEENEFWAQTAVMTTGSVFVGLGTAQAATTFGETATATLWASRLLGGLYGGTTGVISGGPVEGVKQSISMASPVVGTMGVQFFDGWHQGMQQPGSTWKDGLWHGACQAGTGYFVGKAFEIGSSLVTRGALHLVGRNHRLFQPIIWQKPTVQQQFDAARLQQEVDDAISLVNRFRNTQVRYVQAQTRYAAGSPQLAQIERELSSMASSLNSSYHCKWVIKYKSGLLVRRAFKRLVNESYARTMPGFRARLRTQGYNIDDLSFAPIRNHSSAGSTSMDLDLALQETRTILRPDGTTGTQRVKITRNGEEVDLLTFQRDAQRAMNEAYNEATGFSGIRSEVNLTTSVHEEAFANPELLAADVDFSKVRDLSSIGDVLEFKMGKIASDPVLSPIARTQASCREASKEMENMLLKKLRQDLARAQPGSAEARRLQQDIGYWEGMLFRFQQIGRQETDPYQILQIERQIRLDTGGKGTHEVIADVTRHFRQ